mmetsp:Transcript_14098/g.23034  ORF Transcript_14098/g.23034 Transcript_14098/m.23034 type:complete len:327 (+) Transcript_14098:128-1108(+)|eukprot:CAMPEP_0203762456 /NCGR_PEP_ID=MMETSP0098-20131031/15341_1 /ASSEMBLY_ACC=CAM_ASM_000208 /TAXON_ID=96639 /ORGANISM=" , Strain NY0313808BC1" /LENGTH=326 /DNA_ID=CAMNT_0050656881 /DNA_START=138 /DNA_END=1115 /DNA_ORIENTATION=+
MPSMGSPGLLVLWGSIGVASGILLLVIGFRETYTVREAGSGTFGLQEIVDGYNAQEEEEYISEPEAEFERLEGKLSNFKLEREILIKCNERDRTRYESVITSLKRELVQQSNQTQRFTMAVEQTEKMLQSVESELENCQMELKREQKLRELLEEDCLRVSRGDQVPSQISSDQVEARHDTVIKQYETKMQQILDASSLQKNQYNALIDAYTEQNDTLSLLRKTIVNLERDNLDLERLKKENEVLVNELSRFVSELDIKALVHTYENQLEQAIGRLTVAEQANEELNVKLTTLQAALDETEKGAISKEVGSLEAAAVASVVASIFLW